jgi:hypothetical protein
MNFFAHQVIAAQSSEHPRFLLGAMLPDLVGMIGTRILRIDDAEIARGVAHHHQADAAFHASPIFSQLCTTAVHGLTDLGVGRGTARAVGHVGIELLLDGFLSHDRPSRVRYERALGVFAADDLGACLSLRHDEDRARLAAGLERLRNAPVPEGYRDPDFVAARLEHILAHRPRLAMASADRVHVKSWAHSAQAALAHCREQLLAEVEAGLAAHSA